jgi:hypothetical protein
MADNNELQIKVVATGGDAAAKEVAKPTAAIQEQTKALEGLKKAQQELAAAEGLKKSGISISDSDLAAMRQRVTLAEQEVAAEKLLAETERVVAEELAEHLKYRKQIADAEEEQRRAAAKNVPVSAADRAEHARITREAAATTYEVEGAKEINDVMRQRQAIESTLAEAAALRAAGQEKEAALLESEAAVLALTLKYQTQLGLTEAEATVLAKQRLAAEAKITELKAAEAAETKAIALAEKEAAAASAARARGAAADAMLANRSAGRLGTGLGIGGFGGGIALAAPFIVGAITKALTVGVAESEEEFRKLQRAGEETARSIAEKMRLDPVAAMDEVKASVRGIDKEITDLRDRNTFAKIGTAFKEAFGFKGDFAREDDLIRQRAERVEQGHAASLRAVADGNLELESLRLKAEGHNAEAAAIERKRKLQLELEQIAQRHPFDPKATPEEADKSAADVAAEAAQARERFAISEAKATEEIAEARERALTKLREGLQYEALIGAGMEQQAKDLREMAALREQIAGINKADLTTWEKISASATAISTALLKNVQPGIARDRKAMEEAIELKTEFDKQQAEREAEKAARAAEHDADMLERLRGGLAVAQEKLALDEDGARTAGIQRDLDAQIANIRKTMLPENQGIAIALAEQTAEMQKQLVLQQRFNKDFDIARGQLGKGWEEKAAEQQAKKQGAQQDRMVAQKVLDEEDKARREAGLAPLSNEAREARRREILKPRGASREARDRAERDGAIGRMVRKPGTDTDFTGQGADFGGGGGGAGGGAAAANQQAAAAAQALDSSLAQSSAAITNALSQAAQNSQQAAAIASKLLNALVQGKSDLKNLEARVESLENRE